MNKIWLSSDWHFGHDREFIWRPRGFSSVSEHDDELIERHNSMVDEEDDVYILGDLTLGNIEHGKKCIQHMKGKLHIILGNHCTLNRQAMYHDCENVVDMKYADMLKYKGYHFFMCHFPTLTGNLERESLKQVTCNLFGHTHSKEKFYQDIPYLYNVAVDAHDCYPVSLDEVIEDMEAKVRECKEML